MRAPWDGACVGRSLYEADCFVLCEIWGSCWPGLPTVGCPETRKILQFSSNAVLVSFNVHAGRACQPSAGRKPENFCSFRQMQFSSQFMFMLAGLANLRQAGNPPPPPKICSFRQTQFSSRFGFMAGWLGLPTVGCPETQINYSFFVKCNSRLNLCLCWPGLPTLGCPETRKFLQFSSNAILVSFNVHAGRACQPSAPREHKYIAVFR